MISMKIVIVEIDRRNASSSVVGVLQVPGKFWKMKGILSPIRIFGESMVEILASAGRKVSWARSQGLIYQRLF
jgi:hypothetical protein